MNESILSEADRCYRCDYDLRGIFDRQPCPECGLVALHSRRADESVRSSHPAWLRTISRGVLVLIAAFVWPGIACLATNDNDMRRFIFSLFGGGQFAEWMWVVLIQYLGAIFANFLLVVGAFLLTRREDSPAADARDRRERIGLRIFVFLPFVAIGIFYAANAVAQAELSEMLAQWRSGAGYQDIDFSPSRKLFGIAYFIATIGVIPLPILLFRRLRNLARRARSPQLLEHSTIVAVGASLSLAYIGAATFVSNHLEDLGLPTNWVNHGMSSLIIDAMTFVAPLLFGLWTIQVLLRFSWHFRRIAIDRRNEWRRCDQRIVNHSSQISQGR